MYSQYSYQGNSGSTTGQSTTATTVQSTSLSWNGTQWIQIASTPSSNPPLFNTSHQNAGITKIPPPKTQLPPIPAHLNHNEDQSLMSLDQLVSLYSNVYHHYAAEVSSFKNNNINTGREGGRTEEWAVYHCDLSARAAHHYNDLLTNRQNGNAAAEIQTPGPTQVQERHAQAPNKRLQEQNQDHLRPHINNTSTSTTPSKTKTVAASTRSEEPSLEEPPPESFRRYAHKNLLLCKTETQRMGMQELLTMTMGRAIQNGKFQGIDWDYESLLPVPGGGSSQLLQEEINVPDNKMKTGSFDNRIDLPSSASAIQKKNGYNGDIAASFPAKISSDFSSLKRNHSSIQHGEHNGSQDRTMTHPTAETASNLAQQQRTQNKWYGNDTTEINREHNRTGGSNNNDTLDGSHTRTLKTKKNISEQKTTLNDWYGDSGGGNTGTNDDASQAGACVQFVPKIFGKKKKRHNRDMNARKQHETSNHNPSCDAIAGDTVAPVSLVMEENGHQNYTQQKKTVSDWYGSNGFGDNNNDLLSSSPARNHIQENHLKYDGNLVAQQTSRANSQQEDQKQTLSEWHNYSQPLTSSSPSTISPHKKEIEMLQQKQTLDEWYGGNNASDRKDGGEALIVFKPKPLNKKKKKNRKYMKRSLAVVKAKVDSKSRMPPSIVDNGSLNGITMLPPVQSDPTNTRNADYYKGLTNNASNGAYNLHQNEHPNNESCYRTSKQESSPQGREEDFMLLSQTQSEQTTQQPENYNDRKFYRDREGQPDDSTMDKYDSESFSDPLTQRHAQIGNSYHQQKKKVTERYDISPTEPNQSNYLHQYKLQSNNIEVNNTRKNLSPSNQTKGNTHSSDFDQSKNKMAYRASRFAGHGGIATAASSNLHMEYSNDADRYMGKSVIGGTLEKFLTEEDYENMTVKGHCDVLEKSYLRLTSPPRAELVRPQHILKHHLANLKKKWIVYRMHVGSTGNKDLGNSDEMSYTWFCSQLKAVRQDLVVQRIFNNFAVETYEMHAKIALQENDLNEYNQSQTQLKDLYSLLSNQGLQQEGNRQILGMEHENEFVAYRIIYFIFLTGNQKYDGGSSDLLKIMSSLSYNQRQDLAIIHALKVRVAVAENDYHTFFHLHDTCPNLGSYLMDTLVPQMRAIALKQIMKAYKPSLSTMFLLQELGFNMDGGDDGVGVVWLHSCGCKFNHDRSMVLTKEVNLNEAHLVGVKCSSLI